MATAELLQMSDKKTADKQKALDSALAQIERQFGKGSIMTLGGENKMPDIEATSTGSLGLDIALGIGGLPKGRVIEIYGPESSGKTTLTLHAIAEEQKKGGVCAFVDAEHALDPTYAKKLGVNLDELLISQPDTGEQALEIVDTLVRSGAVSMVIVDSVAALTPKSELEGDMGDSSVGVHARLMSQAMRKLTGSINRSGCMVSISKNGELLDLGVKAGIVEKSGAWFSYGDERIGQGRENSKTFLKENPAIAYEIEDKIRAAHGLDFDMDNQDKSEVGDDLLED